MPTLAKLLDCLKWPKVAASGQPIRPRGEIVPSAPPELTFGWQGYLFSNPTPLTGIIAANTVGASVTIPDDCFYLVDATARAENLATVAGPQVTRVALEILDPGGGIAWQLAYASVSYFLTGVGQLALGPPGDTTFALHLLQNMIVRWKLLDATTTSAAAFYSSISIRKLYEETL